MLEQFYANYSVSLPPALLFMMEWLWQQATVVPVATGDPNDHALMPACLPACLSICVCVCVRKLLLDLWTDYE